MKKFLFIAGIAFAVGLAVVVGIRLSPDAMAVVIGIICGVLASIPTSMTMVWVLRHRDRQELQFSQRYPAGHYPPVVVVNGHGQNGHTNGHTPPPLVTSPTPNGSRNFKVIGQENTETVGDVIPPFWDDLS